MTEKIITPAELVQIIILFGLPVSLISRVIQFYYLKIRLKIALFRVVVILIACEMLSWIMTAVIWGKWFTDKDAMFYHICLPTLLGEAIILGITMFYSRRKSA